MPFVYEIWQLPIIRLKRENNKRTYLTLVNNPNYMTSQEFIFSNKPYHRLCRHVIFWLVLSLHFLYQNLIVGGAHEALKPRSLIESLIYTFYFLPIYILSTYLFIYLVIPAFFLKKTIQPFLCTR